jgi:predicted permease
LPLLTDSIGISSFRIPGYEAEGNRPQSIHRNNVGAGFFRLLGIPVIAGREFQATDVMGSLQVAVINETVARKFFEGRNPIGQHLVRGSNPPVDYEIVGVVKDAKYDDLRESTKPFAYFPAAQDATPGTITFYVRTGSSAEVLAPALRQLVRGFDANLPIEGPRTLRSQIMESVFLDRMVAALAAAFAGLATVLAAVGLYGVIAWAIARRRREIGIRMALGARPADVMRMVLREVLWLGLAGMAVAIPAWFAGARLLGSTLFNVAPNDPLALAVAVVVLGVVAVTAGSIPAFRASRIDPNSAIRYE